MPDAHGKFTGHVFFEFVDPRLTLIAVEALTGVSIAAGVCPVTRKNTKRRLVCRLANDGAVAKKKVAADVFSTSEPPPVYLPSSAKRGGVAGGGGGGWGWGRYGYSGCYNRRNLRALGVQRHRRGARRETRTRRSGEVRTTESGFRDGVGRSVRFFQANRRRLQNRTHLRTRGGPVAAARRRKVTARRRRAVRWKTARTEVRGAGTVGAVRARVTYGFFRGLIEKKIFSVLPSFTLCLCSVHAPGLVFSFLSVIPFTLRTRSGRGW